IPKAVSFFNNHSCNYHCYTFNLQKMTQTSKIGIMYGLGAVTLWDTITTIYGTHTIAGDKPIQYFIAVGLGIGLSIVMLRSLPILKNPKEELFIVTAKGM